jgi:hypothetical protein
MWNKFLLLPWRDTTYIYKWDGQNYS